MISGSGLAMASIVGSAPIRRTSSAVIRLALLTPMKTSTLQNFLEPSLVIRLVGECEELFLLLREILAALVNGLPAIAVPF